MQSQPFIFHISICFSILYLQLLLDYFLYDCSLGGFFFSNVCRLFYLWNGMKLCTCNRNVFIVWLHLTVIIIYAKIHCQIVTKTHLIILGLFQSQSQSLRCGHKNKSQICKYRKGTKQNGNLNICCKIPQAHIYRIVCYSHANFVDFVWFLNLLFFGWALVVCGLH